MARFSKNNKVSKPKPNNQNKSLQNISKNASKKQDEKSDEESVQNEDILKNAMGIFQEQFDAGKLQEAIAKGQDVDTTVKGLLDQMLGGVSVESDDEEEVKSKKVKGNEDDDDDEWETTDGSDEEGDEAKDEEKEEEEEAKEDTK
ncbi:Sex-determining transformer protein 2 [Wickerhamomyces ciferrii]|uniref:Sex-determining transformer protein 2 n=1 Tax=Wickerhamomyces ciferrii (strain ATCC 14091 / BCRC 22168 / CBS 111 / JCM 3599 / NBRC 0793 / NRRL Y-1031 F-60-10) TaxID=1206466 RepID=K0K8Y6_WICCF|nr:Sex-determining transformer protein 2 [Wickerhamomyces ciferrii]CCH41310.1 Sex-determining transformer protein 2 [Wickerhamomyces ciferrii]